MPSWVASAPSALQEDGDRSPATALGHDSGGTRMGDISETDSSTGSSDSPRPRRKRKRSKEMVVLGQEKDKKTRHQISASVSVLGGDLGALTIPSRIEWFAYLSYLQNKYG